jgi:hypothetical protein
MVPTSQTKTLNSVSGPRVPWPVGIELAFEFRSYQSLHPLFSLCPSEPKGLYPMSKHPRTSWESLSLFSSPGPYGPPQSLLYFPQWSRLQVL